MNECAFDEVEVILGNSNKRFSGVTSTMLQTLAHQKDQMQVRVLGAYHLNEELSPLSIGFLEAVRLLRQPLKDGRKRVFHARRNDEMIQALILKYVFRAKIRILFTSTAQRHHSAFTRWLMARMDGILSTCEAAARYLKSPPFKIVPHGIQTNVYYPNDCAAAKDKALVLGMFGRVREQKGTHIFVRACIHNLPLFPNARAQIIGAITQENAAWVNSLKKEIADAGLAKRIVFLGEQPFDSLPGYFRNTDIVAALSRTEGFGLTVLEAMSSGAAVIASNAGAWPEIIEQGKHGWVIPTEDQEAVNAKIGALLSSPEKVHAMGEAGRQHILEHYTIEKEAQSLCNIYRYYMNADLQQVSPS